MARSTRKGFAFAALASLGLALPGELRAESATQDSSTPILSAIEQLESASDAKCYSSASRFEDFLYGTPLDDEARQTQALLQKRLALHVWESSSRAAHEAGETSVGRLRIGEQVDPLVLWEDGPEDRIEVSFPGLPPLTLSKRRAEQYGSIAYSLRAILAVQQDSLLDGAPLAPLAADGIELLRQSIDTVTLCALMLADEQARLNNQTQITGENLQATWERLVPNAEAGSQASAREPRTDAPDADSRARVLALLDDMIERKLAAYRTYNDVDESRARALFMFNIGRFYARTPLPRRTGANAGLPEEPGVESGRTRILAVLKARLDEFGGTLLLAAGDRARRAGRNVISATDANAAVQHFVPHEIDEFEDVHLFGRLTEAERLTIEAYDCDSFRDFGIHWPPLKRALREFPENVPLPDPFAAEILAEAISQYGVLLLRIAGEIAGQDKTNVRLQAEDLLSADASIRDRSRRHRESPPRVASRTRLASAPTQPALADEEAFFQEATRTTGIDFVHRSSRWLGEFRHTRLKTPPTFSGGGVAAEDIDGDSDIDLLFVGGIGNSLFINDGHGRFTDVAEREKIGLTRPDGSRGEARQPIIADFDNDGRQDILITYVDDDHQVYRNVGDHFENVSHGSGLGGKGLTAGPAAVFDFDGDGLLDVYIGHMGDYQNGAIPTVDRDNRNALPNQLFRNVGNLRFEEVSKGSGTDDTGWTQATSHSDFDRDGRQDIVVANDFGRNAFLRNLGGGKFENVAPRLGVTKAFHSMNVGISDLNRDGHPDVYISNIATLVKDNKYVFPDVSTPIDFDLRAMAGMLVKESDVLYMSRLEDGRLVAYEPSQDVERGPSSTGWAWGAEFFDFDHDGDDDLYVVNGTNDYNAVFPSIYRHKGDDGTIDRYLLSHRRESNVFFVNEGGKLKNASERSGADFVGNSRSSVYLDLEGDGDLDIAVNNFHAPARVLRNEAERRDSHWLKILLVGDPTRGSSRDAIGARILVTSGAELQVLREVQGGSGYLSMKPKQQHFGLGRFASVDVRITWPGGQEQLLEDVAGNGSYVIQQGVGIVSEPGRTTARTTGGPVRGPSELSEPIATLR